jgi:hypothetical protein
MDDHNQSNPFISVYTPVALLALSLCMLFFSQIMGASQGKDNMTWQTGNAKKQIDALSTNLSTLEKNIADQASNVATAEQTQKQFSEFMKDIVELGSGEKGDKDAQLVMAVANRLNIRFNAPAAEQPKKDEKKNP